MLNYLVFPGVTDREDEVEALVRLVEETGIDLIQMRNLSLDPVMYWQALGVAGEGMGMTANARPGQGAHSPTAVRVLQPHPGEFLSPGV